LANPVIHFEILGPDGKQLQEFYSSVFGWDIDANNEMAYGMVGVQGGQGIGGGVAASQDGKPMVAVYIDVPDIDAALTKAESMGGKVVMPAMPVPGGPTIAQFSDPAGNVIGLTLAGSMPSA
jgi:predicted enzyme related to lactoylglutathione lyase